MNKKNNLIQEDLRELLDYSKQILINEEELRDNQLLILSNILIKLANKIPKIKELIKEEIEELEQLLFVKTELKHNLQFLNNSQIK